MYFHYYLMTIHFLKVAFSESAKLRSLRAKNMLAYQRALRAHVITCQRLLRAYVLTWERAILNNAISYISKFVNYI